MKDIIGFIKRSEQMGLLIVLVLIIVVFSLLQPSFFRSPTSLISFLPHLLWA